MFRAVNIALLGLLALSLSVITPLSPAAADAQNFLNASAWQVEYEFSFKAQSQGQYQSLHGPCEYTTSLNQSVSSAMTLDMRNGGPSISMLRTNAVQDPSSLSLAEQQKFAMDLLAKVDYTANWMSAGVLNVDQSGTDEEQMAAMLTYATATNGTATLEYLRVIEGDDLHDETGAPYKSHTRTRYHGSGKVSTGDQAKFELDSKTKKYILMLYTAFSDSSASTVKVMDSMHTEYQSALHDTVTTSEMNLERCPGRIVVDDSSVVSGEGLFLEGSFDPAADKITGEHSLNAHYSGFQGDIRVLWFCAIR